MWLASYVINFFYQLHVFVDNEWVIADRYKDILGKLFHYDSDE